MADVTLIVAPNAIADIIGVAAVEVSARKLKAKDKDLKVLFQCWRKSADDVTQDFIPLVRLIAERATLESLPKEKTFAQKV